MIETRFGSKWKVGWRWSSTMKEWFSVRSWYTGHLYCPVSPWTRDPTFEFRK